MHGSTKHLYQEYLNHQIGKCTTCLVLSAYLHENLHLLLQTCFKFFRAARQNSEIQSAFQGLGSVLMFSKAIFTFKNSYSLSKRM